MASALCNTYSRHWLLQLQHLRLHHVAGYRRARRPAPTDYVHQAAMEAEQELEQLEEALPRRAQEVQRRTDSEKEAARKRLVHQIMKRKYFKEPQERNLLTWQAKEQIRYLHAEDPHTWTHEAIAQSFPISVQGVKNLFKSRMQLRSWEEVLRHDQRVRYNWTAVLAAGDDPRVVGDRCLLAAGNAALPMPDLQNVFQPPHWRRPDRAIGLFESIVQGYQDLTQVQDDTHQKRLEEQAEENRKLLAQVLEPEQPAKKSQQKYKFKHAERNQISGGDESKYNHTQHKQISSGDQEKWSGYSHKDPLLPEDDGRSQGDNVSKVTHMGQKIPSGRDFAQDLLTKSLDEGSYSRASSGEEATDQDVSSQHGMTTMADYTAFHSKENMRKQKVLDSIQYDKSSRQASGDKEAFIFDSKRGYQYPLGRVDASLKKDNVKRETAFSKDESQKYVESVYDEDGELLYRVPGLPSR